MPKKRWSSDLDNQSQKAAKRARSGEYVGWDFKHGRSSNDLESELEQAERELERAEKQERLGEYIDRILSPRLQKGLTVTGNPGPRIEHGLLTGQRKLLLVLDLDHTLLHTASVDVGTDLDHVSFLDSLVSKDALDVYNTFPSVYTKLRPFVREFLKAANDMFELMVYTMGNRPYANKMVQLLDPDGLYFKGRIITRDENVHGFTKKSLASCNWDPSAALILDDTLEVWPDDLKNLILMPRYKFFEPSRASYGPIHHLVDAEKGIGLDKTLTVLRAIHDEYLRRSSTANEAKLDVRDICNAYRSKVLEGCTLIFRFNNAKLMVNPLENHIWRRALELGAKCTVFETADVTHVISSEKSSPFAQWGYSSGKFVVTAPWILDAGRYMWRIPEHCYAPVF